MKKSILLISMLISTTAVFAQTATTADTVRNYFHEIAAATRQHTALWNIDLYNALLVVDPFTRKVYANMPDSAGLLQQEGDLYTGSLPPQQPVANTSIKWAGRQWAMVLLPLIPNAKPERIKLFAHELFHKAQPSLHFEMKEELNDHLDEEAGRIWLRLELAALSKALTATSAKSRKNCLRDAFTFRQYRRSIFPKATVSENALEILEGMAEYTGFTVAYVDESTAAASLLQQMQQFAITPSYVRSFAYHTVPQYGYLLWQQQPAWNLSVTDATDLTAFFIKAFDLRVPADSTAALRAATRYNGSVVMLEERDRAVKKKEQAKMLKALLVTDPHLEIPLQSPQITFNPSNLIPLEDIGTVYPTMKVSDKWGMLEVNEAGLVYKDWKKVSVSIPQNTAGQEPSGKGWTLKLNSDYVMVKDEKSGNFIIRKK